MKNTQNKKMYILKSFSTEYEAYDWANQSGILDYGERVNIVKTDSIKSFGFSGSLGFGKYHVVVNKGFSDFVSNMGDKLFGSTKEPKKVTAADRNITPASGWGKYDAHESAEVSEEPESDDMINEPEVEKLRINPINPDGNTGQMPGTRRIQDKAAVRANEKGVTVNVDKFNRPPSQFIKKPI